MLLHLGKPSCRPTLNLLCPLHNTRPTHTRVWGGRGGAASRSARRARIPTLLELHVGRGGKGVPNHACSCHHRPHRPVDRSFGPINPRRWHGGPEVSRQPSPPHLALHANIHSCSIFSACQLFCLVSSLVIVFSYAFLSATSETVSCERVTGDKRPISG